MPSYYNKNYPKQQNQSNKSYRDYSNRNNGNYNNSQNFQTNSFSFYQKNQNNQKKQSQNQRSRSRQNRYSNKNHNSYSDKRQKSNTNNSSKFNSYSKSEKKYPSKKSSNQEQKIETNVCKRCHLQNYSWRKTCCRFISYDKINKKIIKCRNNLYPTRVSEKILGSKGLRPIFKSINNAQLPIFSKYSSSTKKKQILKKKQFKIQKFQVQSRFNKNVKSIEKLKILTYNIWGNQEGMNERFSQIIKQITFADADFICIQQTYNFKKYGFLEQLYESLKQNGHQYYYIAPNTQNKQSQSCYYASILLSKYPGSFYEVTLLDPDSKQQKKLYKTTPFTVGVFQFTNEQNKKITISVNSLHLKSMVGGDSLTKQIRLKQIQIMNHINQGIDFVIAAGDMNFKSKQEQEKRFQVEYQYADLQKMIMINPDKYHTYQYTQDQKHRFDRIYIKSNLFQRNKLLNTLRVEAILIGDEETVMIGEQQEQYDQDQQDQDAFSYQSYELSDHKILAINISL